MALLQSQCTYRVVPLGVQCVDLPRKQQVDLIKSQHTKPVLVPRKRLWRQARLGSTSSVQCSAGLFLASDDQPHHFLLCPLLEGEIVFEGCQARLSFVFFPKAADCLMQSNEAMPVWVARLEDPLGDIQDLARAPMCDVPLGIFGGKWGTELPHALRSGNASQFRKLLHG